MKTRIQRLFVVSALAIGLCLIMAERATALTFTTLYSFTPFIPFPLNSDGGNPSSGLVASGNTLYGTAFAGGSSGKGTVFKVNTDGSGFMVLHTFSGGADGSSPSAGLVLSGTTLYGVSLLGGNFGHGTVFKINTDGTGFLTLYHFTAGNDGRAPIGGLAISGTDLYGTTSSAGASSRGTVFTIKTDGTGFTTLYAFTGPDGNGPQASLLLSGNTLYGTTVGGGSVGTGFGVIFKINTDGTGFAPLYSLDGNTDGSMPHGDLILLGTVLYGTTTYAGSAASPSGHGTVFKVNNDGTGFTVLHTFAGFPSDGDHSYGGLVLSAGVLYGTTDVGGSSGQGTAFQINPDGTGYTIIKSFVGGSEGARPQAGLLLAGSGLYGTTFNGAVSTRGTVFKFDLCGIDNFVVAAKNQVVPTTPVGAKFNTFGIPSRNNNGDVAFKATLVVGFGGVTVANSIALYAGALGAEALVVRSSDFAPDTSGTLTAAVFGNFSDPAYNNAGEIAFRGVLKSGIGGVSSSNNFGLWSNVGGTMHLVARKGDVAPGTGGATFASFTSFGLPDTDDVVFIGTLTLGTGSPVVTAANNVGIWVFDCSHTLDKVRQTGDSVVVNGTPKTIRTMSFLPEVAFSFGQGRNANNNGGKLAYRATFTDLSMAILGANYQ